MNSNLDQYPLDQDTSNLPPESLSKTEESQSPKDKNSLSEHTVTSFPNKPCPCCYIIPPYLQDQIEIIRQNGHLGLPESPVSGNHPLKQHQFSVFQFFSPFHQIEGVPVATELEPLARLVRNVYDGTQRRDLPGKWLVSVEGDQSIPSTYKQNGTIEDTTVNQALQNALDVFLFYLNNYQYNSFDGEGKAITSTVHYGKNYENAFWNGNQMVYGDGSSLFEQFVSFPDVVGHELTHGITGDRLAYEGESGAVNEHFSDVMGYLIYMYINHLTTEEAEWEFAKGILHYKDKSYPLRSFKEPGAAYNIPGLGKDLQPSKYSNLYKGSNDNGGVHINSGIPNHAFYLFAVTLGGNPWEKAGLIWFTTMMRPGAFPVRATMKEFAEATIKTTQILFPEETTVCEALIDAWQQVEVIEKTTVGQEN